jgi:integrase
MRKSHLLRIPIELHVQHFLDLSASQFRKTSRRRMISVITRFRLYVTAQGCQFIDELKPAVLDGFLRWRSETSSPKTVYQECAIILRVFNGAALTFPSVHAAKRPAIAPLSAAAVLWLISILSPENRVMVALMAFAGLRFGELGPMRELVVDWNRQILIVKSGKYGERIVPLHRNLAEILKVACGEVLEEAGHLWRVALNPEMKLMVVRTAIKRCSLGAGDLHTFGVHSLRLYFQEACLEAGVPTKVLWSWMGRLSQIESPVDAEKAVRLINTVKFHG